jgi:hypothetical protein
VKSNGEIPSVNLKLGMEVKEVNPSFPVGEQGFRLSEPKPLDNFSVFASARRG